jgi:DnaA family protein
VAAPSGCERMNRMRQLPLGVKLPDHATFASFHGGVNRPAVECLQAVTTGRLTPAAVYVCGGEASGKSHLLQASCAAATAAGKSGGYLSLASLAEHGVDVDVLDGWAGRDIVCLDDAQTVIGARHWETAIMQLYNRMTGRGGVLVVASAVPVEDAGWHLPDLRSRLAAGLQVVLTAPGDEDVLAALQLRAAARGMELPRDAATWLLRRYRRDMHSLCALLDSLDAASLARQRRLTVPFVRECVENEACRGPESS